VRDKLIKYRGKRSQEEMAKMYGVSQQAWSKYENGTAVPSPSIMLRIERDSGIKMEDIFFDKFKQPNVVK
jgi:transcriptional regulator with XRE-family HTH domain